jgi:hypothetical protein
MCVCFLKIIYLCVALFVYRVLSSGPSGGDFKNNDVLGIAFDMSEVRELGNFLTLSVSLKFDAIHRISIHKRHLFQLGIYKYVYVKMITSCIRPQLYMSGHFWWVAGDSCSLLLLEWQIPEQGLEGNPRGRLSSRLCFGQYHAQRKLWRHGVQAQLPTWVRPGYFQSRCLVKKKVKRSERLN